MISNRLSVSQIEKQTRSKVSASKILGTFLASGLLLSFIALPSFAQGVSPDNPQHKTTELAKKCQDMFGPNSANPDQAKFRKCLRRVLRVCVQHTGNPQLCKQWIKSAVLQEID